jgi:hypothetical protein
MRFSAGLVSARLVSPRRSRRVGPDGLVPDGLETRRWNGTKSAFADCTPHFLSRDRLRGAAPAISMAPVNG